MRRTAVLIWKELIELRRDPRLFSIVILAPIVQLLVLAYAATTDIRNVPVVIADLDRSAGSRELIERFQASPSFALVAVTTRVGDLDRYLEHGDAWLAITIPAGYNEAVASRGSGDCCSKTRNTKSPFAPDTTGAGASAAGIGFAGFTPTTFSKKLTKTARPVGTFGLC